MKKFIALISSVAVVSLASISTANAQSLISDGNYTLSGTLALSQTVGAVCQVDGDLLVVGGTGVITNVTFTGPSPCGSPVSPLSSTWYLISTGSGSASVWANANAVFGACDGWTNNTSITTTPNQIVFSNAKLAGYLYSSGNPPRDCYVDGTLTVTNSDTPTKVLQAL